MRCCKQLSIKINAAGGSSSVAFQRYQNIFYANDNFQNFKQNFSANKWQENEI
jgi:hypothetical protein